MLEQNGQTQWDPYPEAEGRSFSDFFSTFSREYLSDLENGKSTAELGRALDVVHALSLRLTLSSDEAAAEREGL